MNNMSTLELYEAFMTSLTRDRKSANALRTDITSGSSRASEDSKSRAAFLSKMYSELSEALEGVHTKLGTLQASQNALARQYSYEARAVEVSQ